MRKMIAKVFVFVLISLLVGIIGVMAQTDNVLVPDVPTTGTIAQGESVKIFTFSANAGATARFSISSETGFALTMVVSDATGTTLGQVQKPAGAASGAESLIENLILPVAGTYYVNVLITPGVVTALNGEFVIMLTLEGGDTVVPPTDVPLTADPTPEVELPPTTITTTSPRTPSEFAPRQVSLPNGINVSLTWQTQDDLNLQVRAPNGNTLFWDSRSTNDGGTFGPDVNGLCGVLSTPPAVETATWGGGPLAAGSYEVLVYYRQVCSDTPAPVDFTVDVTVNGVPLTPITGTLQPPLTEATVHIARFVVNDDGTADTDNGGLYTDTRVLSIPFSQILVSPSTPLFFNNPTEGLITNDQYYQVYTFTGTAGQLVDISMEAAVGNLDTLLILFDATGTVIADNDDVDSPRNTNSLISTRLPTSGTYLVFASRYGKDVGGTEGTYIIEVSQQGAGAGLNLNFPTGDIEVTLIWDTNADLQLLVRDPFGESVYDDRPSVRSGGLLTATGNQNCVTSTTSPPAYHIYWPSGTRDIGPYEIEVWYQSECGDTRPVSLSLFVVVGGELVFTDTMGIRFNEKYVTSFVVNSDGTVSPSLAGIIGGSETLPYQTELDNAIVIQSGANITGSITPNNKFDVYAFDGQVGDVVTIAMNANSPTLDPLLFLIDPSLIEIATNDDASADTRNSLISNLTLSRDGRYYILATHFAAIYGGTVGPYTLTLQIQRPAPPETTP